MPRNFPALLFFQFQFLLRQFFSVSGVRLACWRPPAETCFAGFRLIHFASSKRWAFGRCRLHRPRPPNTSLLNQTPTPRPPTDPIGKRCARSASRPARKFRGRGCACDILTMPGLPSAWAANSTIRPRREDRSDVFAIARSVSSKAYPLNPEDLPQAASRLVGYIKAKGGPSFERPQSSLARMLAQDEGSCGFLPSL